MRILLALLGLMAALAACAPQQGPAPGQGAGEICGGLQGLSCGAGAYCAYAPEARCGAADQTGMCRPVPEACTMQYDPVCGCDAQTYGNACTAAASGVSVAHEGECG